MFGATLGITVLLIPIAGFAVLLLVVAWVPQQRVDHFLRGRKSSKYVGRDLVFQIDQAPYDLGALPDHIGSPNTLFVTETVSVEQPYVLSPQLENELRASLEALALPAELPLVQSGIPDVPCVSQLFGGPVVENSLWASAMPAASDTFDAASWAVQTPEAADTDTQHTHAQDGVTQNGATKDGGAQNGVAGSGGEVVVVENPFQSPASANEAEAVVDSFNNFAEVFAVAVANNNEARLDSSRMAVVAQDESLTDVVEPGTLPGLLPAKTQAATNFGALGQHPVLPSDSLPHLGGGWHLGRKRGKGGRIVLAEFPYDPSAWEDPLPPGKRRRKKRAAERAAKKLVARNKREAEQAAGSDLALIDSSGDSPALLGVVGEGGVDVSTRRGRKHRRATAGRKTFENNTGSSKDDLLVSPALKLTLLERLSHSRNRASSIEGTDLVSEALVALPVTIDESQPAWEAEVLVRGQVLAPFDAFASNTKIDNASAVLSKGKQRRAIREAKRESKQLEQVVGKTKRSEERVSHKEKVRQARQERENPAEQTADGLGDSAVIGSVDVVESVVGGSVWDAAVKSETVEPALEAADWAHPDAAGLQPGMGKESTSAWDDATLARVAGYAALGEIDQSTSAEDWLELGELIAPVADPDTTDEQPPQKRRGLRRKKGASAVTETVEEWGADLTYTAVTDQIVNHRDFDLPEPIPDRAGSGAIG